MTNMHDCLCVVAQESLWCAEQQSVATSLKGKKKQRVVTKVTRCQRYAESRSGENHKHIAMIPGFRVHSQLITICE